MYAEYPELIKKTPEGKFDFEITFLKRSKRLKYFFGMSQDGADAMKNLYNFFADKNPKFTNYYKELCAASNGKPLNPVIFLFDNEMANNKKPLYSFVSYADIKGNKKELLEKELAIKVIDEGNLFLMTNPLIEGTTESEIEDLFDEVTLKHSISGKIFSKKENSDKEKYYGKEIFANYIQSSYQSINFDGFKPLLNGIVKVIADYNNDAGAK